MFLRLKASDAALKTAISVAPDLDRPLIALQVGHQHRIAHAGRLADAAEAPRPRQPAAVPISG